MYSFGYFPGVWLNFIPHTQPLKMELIECSETSAYCNFNQTPGKYPKEYTHLRNSLFNLHSMTVHKKCQLLCPNANPPSLKHFELCSLIMLIFCLDINTQQFMLFCGFPWSQGIRSFADTRKIFKNTMTLQITGTCSYLNTLVSLKEAFKGIR